MGLELAGKVFNNGLTDAMYHVYTVDQFHSVWNRMIATTFPGEGHGGHPWLERIYKFRAQWSSAWVDNNRTCGMRSSQLSESLNASLRGYLDTKHNLPSFFREFARMLGGKEKMNRTETIMLLLCFHSIITLDQSWLVRLQRFILLKFLNCFKKSFQTRRIYKLEEHCPLAILKESK
ncbi:hypothetical protein LINGRAHAP2_LOCUS14124 [Linum grandiflorum]